MNNNEYVISIRRVRDCWGCKLPASRQDEWFLAVDDGDWVWSCDYTEAARRNNAYTAINCFDIASLDNPELFDSEEQKQFDFSTLCVKEITVYERLWVKRQLLKPTRIIVHPKKVNCNNNRVNLCVVTKKKKNSVRVQLSRLYK